MKLYKSLEIPIKDIKENTADILFNHLSRDHVYLNWIHEKKIKNNNHKVVIEIIEYREDSFFDSVNEFIKILKTNKAIIEEYKLEDSNISLSIDYEYDQQCNMEFQPYDLKKMGDYGMELCISCWQNGGNINLSKD